jgi:hypothetical protein
VRADRFYPCVLIAWFFAAVALGDSGRLALLDPPAPQILIAVLTGFLLLNGMVLPGLRAWLARLDLHRLIAVHLFRFVGLWFVVLYGRGLLPYDFAVKGGIGDVVVATGAAVLLVVPALAARRTVVLAWNVLGLADILFVVATAARLGMHDPSAMRMLLVMPLALVPTFLVPLVIATHVWIFERLARGALR